MAEAAAATAVTMVVMRRMFPRIRKWSMKLKSIGDGEAKKGLRSAAETGIPRMQPCDVAHHLREKPLKKLRESV
ncbi:hypothetical protein AB0937_29565 [Streptomyces sp. NPDC047880]|uniref:hypothetical protein n=1 Tax=Streptomyces sp. NPDC047880 TaxID=3155626 RepID=UPI003455AE87